MCAQHHLSKHQIIFYYLIAIITAVVAGMFDIPFFVLIAEGIQLIFQRLMKLISVPIIFLSVFSIVLKMHGKMTLKKIFKQSLFYTLSTTILSSLVAICLIVSLKNPHHSPSIKEIFTSKASLSWNFLTEIIPEHAFQPFMTGNVLSSLLLALFMGIAFTKISGKEKIENSSSIILDGLMKMASILIKGMPFMIFSGLTMTIKMKESFQHFQEVGFFLLIVLLANCVQGLIVLPILLKFHRISAWKTFLGYKTALLYAFISKSSVATLPVATQCAERNLDIHPEISRFTFPIFTTINMNGCAAFIVTALCLSCLHDYQTLTFDKILLSFTLSVIAAIGNAGVPMGCYFLSTALLSGLGLKLELITLILPAYALIDMVETSLNVWSDAVITTIIDQKYKLGLLETRHVDILPFIK
jgi:Na+/H+-dicarboxylate symporter